MDISVRLSPLKNLVGAWRWSLPLRPVRGQIYSVSKQIAEIFDRNQGVQSISLLPGPYGEGLALSVEVASQKEPLNVPLSGTYRLLRRLTNASGFESLKVVPDSEDKRLDLIGYRVGLALKTLTKLDPHTINRQQKYWEIKTKLTAEIPSLSDFKSAFHFWAGAFHQNSSATGHLAVCSAGLVLFSSVLFLLSYQDHSGASSGIIRSIGALSLLGLSFQIGFKTRVYNYYREMVVEHAKNGKISNRDLEKVKRVTYYLRNKIDFGDFAKVGLVPH